MGKAKNREKFESQDQGNVTLMAPRGLNFESREKLKGKNPEQQKLINLIYEMKVVIATGPQGTGKTFPASVIAWDMLTSPHYSEMIKSITLVRPNEPLGSTLGFMKGDLYEKYKHWLAPVEDGILWRMEGGKSDITSRIKAKNTYKDLINSEIITPTPVEHLRGRTWNNTFVIIDEAQNLSREAMGCILGRIGEDCRVVFCGDLDQVDLKNPYDSGLMMLEEIHAYARDNDLRAPHAWVDLETTVRSHECDWYTNAIKQIDGFNPHSRRTKR